MFITKINNTERETYHPPTRLQKCTNQRQPGCSQVSK